MAAAPLRVGCIGMGWWSDVLADAIGRSGKLEIAACYTRSADKRAAFAAKYGCRPVASYEAILADPAIEAIVNERRRGIGAVDGDHRAEEVITALTSPSGHIVKNRSCCIVRGRTAFHSFSPCEVGPFRVLRFFARQAPSRPSTPARQRRQC